MNNQKTNNASMSEQELLTDLLHSERDAVKAVCKQLHRVGL